MSAPACSEAARASGELTPQILMLVDMSHVGPRRTTCQKYLSLGQPFATAIDELLNLACAVGVDAAALNAPLAGLYDQSNRHKFGEVVRQGGFWQLQRPLD